jgi:hypothetical protein
MSRDDTAPTRTDFQPVTWFLWVAVALLLWAVASVVVAIPLGRVLARVASPGTE